MNWKNILVPSSLTAIVILAVTSPKSEAMTTNLYLTDDARLAIIMNVENKDSEHEPSRGDSEPKKRRE
ncbi:hypothetical protein M595_3247 [Lyngbya aestuarii BL J]|uniref:Uncharacterized protein n=1 Tax=Lyngbya aestuarii BL J TaxID=1348334 RepID=U7QK16_9CYAN|nr:hypothetical protein [Lyngbya aestuarii]ERT06776.1 hypothetical protein M595_3247 [Lyngbya aestuarii BL J]